MRYLSFLKKKILLLKLTLLISMGVFFAGDINILATSKIGSLKQQTQKSTNSLLKNYLERSAFRHKILAQNLSNINTPGYQAQEVEIPANLENLSSVSAKNSKLNLNKTSAKHMGRGIETSSKFVAKKLKDPYEIKPNGNNVSLAQQMTKISQNQQDYNTALKGYSTLNNLVSTVVGK